MARQLLDDDDDARNDGIAESKCSQGVHWLLCSATQGHEGALQLLGECYASGRGINEYNEYNVQAFLDQSPSERAARRAARELFACLSNGEHYITAAQLERKMRAIWNLQRSRHRNASDSDTDDEADGAAGGDAAGGHISPSPYRYRHADHHSASFGQRRPDLDRCITEANLVSAAVRYAHGDLPTVNQALTLSTPHPDALDHIPCFHRLIFHPITFFVLCYHRFINTFASMPESTVANIRFLLLLLVYTFMSSDSLTMFVPLGAHYLSLLVMFVSTIKMLKAKQEFIDFRMWSGLFLSYGDHRVDAEASENQFLRNRMKPYLWFFGAFCGNVMLTPFISEQQWMPHSEITVVAFVLVFVTMLAPGGNTMAGPDWLVLVSFGINVLAKYPYEMDEVVTTGWRFLDLKVPNFPSFVLGNGIEFCLSCRALLYLLIPGVLVLLARRRRWHGTYQYVIPHCVTLSWLQICIISSQCATMFGLVRAALGLAGLLLFLPLFGIVTLMIPVFAAVEWLSLTDPTMRFTTCVAIAIGAILVSCLLAANQRTEKYVTMLQIFACVMATAFLTLPYMTSNFDSVQRYDAFASRRPNSAHTTNTATSSLSWEQFQRYCQQPAWDQQNRIHVQLRCAELDGVAVNWEGTVASAQIARVINVRADLVNQWLPRFWANVVSCWFGRPNRVQCSAGENCDGMAAYLDDAKRCNLHHWATFEYSMVVRMPVSGLLSRQPEVQLRAQHEFGNFTKQLNASDRIRFRAVLRNTVGVGAEPQGGRKAGLAREIPVMDLVAIGCVQCPNAPHLDSFELADAGSGLRVNGRVQDLHRGVKYLLNVLLNPLVTFK